MKSSRDEDVSQKYACKFKKCPRKIIEWIQFEHGSQGMTNDSGQKQSIQSIPGCGLERT